VGRLAKGKKKLIVSRTDSLRVLVLVIVVAAVPILGTALVTAATSQPDLSELSPIQQRAGDYLVLDWSALTQTPAGREIQALGYMMDGDRSIGKGEWVQEFLLLPEAGTFFHPAHRVRDQMIGIHLADGNRIQFSPRTLVWVWGSFRVSSDAARSKPLYILERARTKSGRKSDIQQYFN
jgi:hypothetical protein